MAVAHDVATEAHTGTTGHSGSGSFSWSHNPTGVPKGVLVFVYTVSATKTVTGVTYDGVALTEITAAAAVDTATEPGRVDVFYLGSGVPTTDPATIVVSRTNNAVVMTAVSVTVTAAADTEIYQPGIVLLQNDGAIAAQSVTDGSPGTNSVRYAGCYYGGASPAPVATGSTNIGSIDLGAFGFSTAQETTAGQGARNVGFTQATSDDRAVTHFAIREVGPQNHTKNLSDTITLSEGFTPTHTPAPGIGPVRTGTASQVNGQGGDGSTSVTVPADATGAVAFWAHWDGNAGSTLATLTLGGNSFFGGYGLQIAETGDKAGQGVAFLNTLPGTGSQTLAWTWSSGGARTEGGEIVIVWVKNTNTSDPVRDADAANAAGSTPVSVTLDTTTDDLLLAFAQSWNPLGDNPFLDGTVFINDAFLADQSYDVSQVTPSSPTTTVNMGGQQTSSMAAISLKPAASGPTDWTKSLSDTLTLSDAVGKAPKKALTDTITSSDSVAKGPKLAKSDSITLSDAAVKAPKLAKADSITLSDALTRAWGALRSFADTLTLSDAVTKRVTLAKADTITLTDAAGKGIKLAKADTITLADAFGRTWVISRTFADTVTLSEGFTPVHTPGGGGFTASDDFNRADGALGSPWVQAGIDNVRIVSNVVTGTGVNEALAYRPGFSADHSSQVVLSSSAQSGPAVRVSAGRNGYFIVPSFGTLYKIVAGGYTAVGSAGTWVTGDVCRLEVEGTTLRIYKNGSLVTSYTDTALTTGQPGIRGWDGSVDDWAGADLGAGGGTDHTLSLDDTITLVDAILKAVFVSKADTVTLSDAIVKAIKPAKADTITLTDSTAKRVTHPVADTITLQDSIGKRATLAKADTVTLTDSIAKSLSHALSDTLGLVDAIAKSAGVELADVVTLEDSTLVLLNGESPWARLPGRSRHINIRFPGIY